MFRGVGDRGPRASLRGCGGESAEHFDQSVQGGPGKDVRGSASPGSSLHLCPGASDCPASPGVIETLRGLDFLFARGRRGRGGGNERRIIRKFFGSGRGRKDYVKPNQMAMQTI